MNFSRGHRIDRICETGDTPLMAVFYATDGACLGYVWEYGAEQLEEAMFEMCATDELNRAAGLFRLVVLSAHELYVSVIGTNFCEMTMRVWKELEQANGELPQLYDVRRETEMVAELRRHLRECVENNVEAMVCAATSAN